MVINVTPLAEGKILEFSFRDTLPLDNSYNLHDYNVDISVEGNLSKQGTLYICKADVTAKIKFSCDKCLKLTTRTLEFSMEEKFSNVEYFKADEEEVNLFHDSQIDLKDYVMSSLSVNMPMQVFCDEDCKGLCHVCGIDLNTDTCNCDSAVIDPRFETLRSIFNDNGEV